MRIMIDPRTELLMTAVGLSLARVLDARQRHAVALALDMCSYIVAALPPDEDLTFGDVVRLLRWFAEGLNKGAEDGDAGN